MNSGSFSYHPLPQPNEIDIREKEDAMGAYFMMFATLAVGLPLPLINLVAAFIYLYLNRKTSRFVHFHSLQSLYSQIPVTVLNAGLVVWLIVILVNDFTFGSEFKGYAIMVGVANLIYLIFSLLAAAKARKGLFYYFIFFGRLAYHRAYMIDAGPTKMPVNKPPSM
jgi:uncharacterized Tic20 family protein